MADDVFESAGQPTLQQLVDYLVEAQNAPANLKRQSAAQAEGFARGQVIAYGALGAGVAARQNDRAAAVDGAEGLVEKAIGFALAHLVGHLLGIEVPPQAIQSAGLKSGQSVIGKAIGDTILQTLEAPAGELQPGTEGAVRLLGALSGMAIKGWFETTLLEYAESLGGILHPVEKIGDLVRDIISATGIDELGRLALRPLGLVTIATPLEWHAHKTFRPTLLAASTAIRQFFAGKVTRAWLDEELARQGYSPLRIDALINDAQKYLAASTAVRQFARGRWTRDRVNSELAQQGYTDERVEALINEQQKFFSPGDVRTFVERQHWTQDQGLQHLRDQGYEKQAALDVLRLEGLRIFESHEAGEASVIISAYASQNIERADFLGLLDTYIQVPTQRALYEESGELRRRLNIKHLSSTQAAACVRSHVLAYVDYRRALEREGYDPEAVTALELLLRFEIDKQKSIEDHRRELEAERAQEKFARDAAAAERKAQIDRERALKRRGPIAELERAAVRGLIPFARVEEVLAVDYDPDTVAIIIAGVEVDRQRYLEQLAAAEEAKKRGQRRNVDVGALEAAVFANLLTIEEFATRLQQLHFDQADAQLLAGVLRARKADQDAARRKRDEAEAAAKRRRIDLGRFERLVRLGARSMGDYAALLEQLGFDDASRAAMIELLNLEIAKDRAADQARAAGEAKLRAKGLSLEQFRRAVILGAKSVDAYNGFLVTQGFTADAIATLVAEAEAAVADAAAARARRDEAARRAEEPTLALSTIARAARLGIVPPALYQERLAAAGYSADDVAIEMELLTTEIADVAAARAKRDQAPPAPASRGLTLAQLAAAVKKGVSSIEDYRARAVTLGYVAEDVDTLIDLLRAELELLKDAHARRALVEDQLAARQISLEQLEGQVASGSLTIDAYAAELERLGIAAADVDLLATLLASALESTPPEGP